MDKHEAKALDDIESYGCHIIHVMEDESLPRFSYSIGIEQCTGQPELIVTGLDQELAHWLINEYNRRVKSGETFKPDQFYSGFLDKFDVTFKKVQQQFYPTYFGWAHWLYKGDSFRALQLIYPSTKGMWPWDSNASDDFTWFIPQLYLS